VKQVSLKNSIRYLPRALPLASLLFLQPFGVSSTTGGGADEIPQDALIEILKKQEEIAFVGERIHTHVSQTRRREDTVFRQRVLHIPPSEYRIDFLDLPGDRESHVLVQGDNLYQWGEGDTVWVSERTEVQTLGLVISHTYLDLLRRNYNIEAEKGPQIAERSTYAVNIVPMHPGRPSLKAWVDSTYGVPLKVEVFDSRERLVRRFEYTRIRFGRRLRVETFSLPEGDMVRRESRGTEYLSPEDLKTSTGRQVPVAESLPAGFTLTRIVHGFSREREYVQSFYSDGYASFSLFAIENEKRAPEGSEKPGIRGVRSGHRRDYAYASGWIGMVQLTAMGDIAESELLEVLSSVKLHLPDPD
jgi:negative regulator of sigma E activity